MSRSIYNWLAFGVCLAVVLAAMGWISATVLRLDNEHRAAQRRAALEENARLALWRMDSTLLPLIVQENARPFDAYQSSRTSDNSEQRGSASTRPRLPPTPTPMVLCYFQLAPDSSLSLPPTQTAGEPDGTRDSEPLHTRLAEFADRDRLLSRLPDDLTGSEPSIPPPDDQVAIEAQQRQSPMAQQVLNTNEFQSRARKGELFNNAPLGLDNNSSSSRRSVNVGPLTPVWIDKQLLLARRALDEDQTYVQGLWLDWPSIRSLLIDEIRDLLPNADIVPVTQAADGDQSRLLTTIPARLVPGTLPRGESSGLSVIHGTLILSWIGALAAALFAAALLYGVISLSNRRRAFVSAVTHELRTPLTTFQLYTEMLDDGFVRDEAKQKSYLQTLRAEAGRLGHLVENVLAYAQLERTGNGNRAEDITVSDLLSRVSERLQQRAEQAEMQLSVDCDLPEPQPVLHVDTSAVERILFNLVDNAGKYAANVQKPLIELSCRQVGAQIEFRVRDYGPGTGGRSLFRPFSKSATEAARTKPGIGLGLSLSRRLARDLGGDLQLDESNDVGACFVLTLPTH